MNAIRVGIAGIGAAGTALADAMIEKKVSGAVLAAVCGSDATMEQFRNKHACQIGYFEDYGQMLASGLCDAVIVSTPHRLHPQQALQALEAGLHVFSEKPAGIECALVRKAVRRAAELGLLYGINFNRRVLPLYLKLRAIVRDGQIGEIRRFHWTSTNWLRAQSYFDSSDWRGTWAGEGGGVLLNQCPHMLDMLQWVCGAPSRIRAQAYFGKHHNIEVEDEVTAFFEYASGATGVFVAGTGEYPGSNRIEIAGDRGRLVVENDSLIFEHTNLSIETFIRESKAGFKTPELIRSQVVTDGECDIITGILQNFILAVQGKEELMVQAEEGLRSLELANGMLLSAWTDNWVELPLNDGMYEEYLAERIRRSKPKQNVVSQTLSLAESLKV